jgi:hypothetical protein
MGDRPIFHVVEAGEDKFNFSYFKENVALKSTPVEGDIIYFDDKPPYYKVLRIMHNMGKFHVVFVVVEPLILENNS